MKDQAKKISQQKQTKYGENNKIIRGFKTANMNMLTPRVKQRL